MSTITIDSDALYRLIEEVVERVRAENKTEDKWISGEEAMALLRITSKTTLQKLKHSGKIGFTQPMKKLILYDRESILAYLEAHSQKPF